MPSDKTWWSAFRAWMDAVLRYLFGRDLFISYSRKDASNYATALANQLRKEIPSLTLYLDRFVAPPSGELPRALKRDLRWSGALIIVATTRALESRSVAEEVRHFAETGRQVIPISVDGTWGAVDFKAVPWSAISGAAEEPETLAAITDGRPSPQVIDRIRNSVQFTRQDERLRRAVRATVFSVLALIALAAVTSFLIVTFARAEAQRQIADAQRRVESANAQAASAAQNAAVAGAQAQAADALAAKAEQRSRDATDARTVAEAAQKTAERKTEDAEQRQARAERLERRATLVSQARTALNNGDPLKAYRLSRQSLEIDDAADARLLAASAYNAGVPLELAHFTHVKDLKISPTDPTKIAAIGTPPAPRTFGNGLRLWDLASHKHIDLEGHEFLALEFAPDGQSLFAVAVTESRTVRGSGLDAEIEYSTALIKYNLALQPLATQPIGKISPKTSDEGRAATFRKPWGDWDVRDVLDMRVDRTQTRLILAGSASPSAMRMISNATPHHLRSWFNLGDLAATHSVDTENELSSFHAYTARVEVLGDRDQIVVDGTDEVYTIDMRSGGRTLIGRHTSNVSDVAASPSGRQVVTIGRDNKVSVFTAARDTWSQDVLEIGGDLGGHLVTFVDETTLAIAREDFSITVVTTAGEPDPDQRLVLDGSTVWRTRREYTLAGHTGTIRYLRMSPDGQSLVSASEDKTIRLWPFHHGHTRILYGNTRGVTRLQFSADARRLVAGGTDGTVRVYDVTTPHHFTLAAHPGSAVHESRVSDSQWDEGGGLTMSILRERLGFVRELELDHRTQTIHARTYDRRTTIWSKDYTLISSDQRAHNVESPTHRSLSPRLDGSWPEVQSERLVLHQEREPPDTTRVARGDFSPDGRWFVHVPDERTITLWNLGRPTQPVRLQAFHGRVKFTDANDKRSPVDVRFSPNGAFAAVAFWLDGEAICLIDLAMARVTIVKADIVADAFDVSDDGNVIAAGRTGEVYLYERDRESILALERHARYVTSVAFSRDGKWIASGGRDRTARLWSRDGRSYAELKLLNPVEAVLFSPSGTELLVAAGRAVQAWYVPSGSLPSLESVDADRRSPGEPAVLHTTGGTTTRAFLVHRPGRAAGRVMLEESFGRPILPTDARRTELVRSVLATQEPMHTRVAAAIELGVHGSAVLPAVPQLAAALAADEHSEETPLTAPLSAVLRGIGAASEAPLIAAFRSSSDERVKRGLAWALPSLFPESARVRLALRDALTDPDDGVRVVSALALERVTHDPAAIPALGQALLTNHRLKREAGDALGTYGVDAVPTLIAVLNADVRSSHESPTSIATETLASIGQPAAPLLIQALRASAPERAPAIVEAMGRLGPTTTQVKPVLIEILQRKTFDRQKDWSVLSAALRAVAKVRATEAIPHLIEVLMDSNKPQLDATYALRDMGVAALEPLMQAYPKASPSTRRHIFDVFGHLGPAAAPALPVMLDAVESGDQWVVHDSLEALAKVGPAAAPAVPVILKLLPKLSGYSRLEGMSTLAAIGVDPDASITAIVAELVKQNAAGIDRQFMIQDQAIKALAADGMPRDMLIILERIKDDVPRIEQYFVGILERELGEDVVVRYREPLLRRLEYTSWRACDGDFFYRHASEALAKFGPAASAALPALEATKSHFPRCVDIQRDVDEALASIRGQSGK
jgi:WD40 repeat protein